MKDHETLENIFMEMENSFIPHLKQLSKGNTSLDIITSVTAYTALQMLRVPGYLRSSRQLYEETVKLELKHLDLNGLIPKFPEDENIPSYSGKSVTELLNEGQIFVNSDKGAGVHGLLALPNITETLALMNKVLLFAPQDHYFILSDHPVTIYDPDLIKNNTGFGISYPNVEVTMPITKDMAILFTHKPTKQELLLLTPKEIKQINYRSAFNCERFCVFPRETKYVRKILQTFPDGNTKNTEFEDSSYQDQPTIKYRNWFTSEEAMKAYKKYLRPLKRL